MSIDSRILESLGWALIHSMWQAAAVFILFVLASGIFGKDANRRYVMALVALTAVPVAFVCTFFLMLEQSPATIFTSIGTQFVASSRDMLTSATAGVMAWIDPLLLWIDLHLAWVIRIWLIGSMIGLVRVISGMMYLRSLRLNALAVSHNWEEKVKGLAIGLHITRKVSVAEARVSTPMVIGYLKPIVLFPIGLMSGLAPEQVEAILLHELAHIRRHDFVVNLFQCMMESIFFFNPIVWILSARIRTLREHCCDDLVIKKGVNPLAYVKTLALVEETAGGSLALALIGERNQMLNRMKRIMEKSIVKKEWGGMRVLPLGLVLIGLICASWLSIGTEQHDQSVEPAVISDVAGDSTVEKTPGKELQSSYYYKYNLNDGEAKTQPGIAGDDVGAHIWTFPGATPQIFQADSIPGFHYSPGDWEKFEKEFTEKFSKEFGEFFNKNQQQFEKMMEELRHQHRETDVWAFHDMEAMSADQMRAMEEQFRHLNLQIPDFEKFLVPEPMGFPSPDAKMLYDDATRMAESGMILNKILRDHPDMMRAQEELMHHDEMLLRQSEEALHEYEKALVEQLIEDGYLEKGESLGDLRIHNDEITVNGKKIKEKDAKKYKDISTRYQPRWSPPRRPE
jgi:bla regulator protein BlaR1